MFREKILVQISGNIHNVAQIVDILNQSTLDEAQKQRILGVHLKWFRGTPREEENSFETQNATGSQHILRFRKKASP